MTKFKILGVFTGKVAPLSNKTESAIIKHPCEKLIIRKDSIDHNEIANHKYHGGDMRVVHHYSHQNYNFLKAKFPELSHLFIPGSFGENIVTEELTETELNIGDIYSLGTAKVQLTVSRRPCATINYAYNDNRILKEVMQAGRTGWFYRVLEEGEVKVGDYLDLLESPFPNMPVSKLYDQGYGKNHFSDIEFLKKCLQTGLMDKGWKPKIEEVLSTLHS
jgi:MOSC domain-containing protein YiiM